VRFLVDAQLPHRLSQRLTALGHEATHTSELVEGNRTTDRVICAHADAIEATVITKDADFVINRTLHGSPRRLLVIATGNIGNLKLLELIETNLPTIEGALVNAALVELGRDSLTIHD
jgi:predicted nuclease of predicted toxin-antitoxin system